MIGGKLPMEGDGWSFISVLEQHYTGDVADVHWQAMERIAKATA